MLGVNSARALHLQNALTQYEKLNTGKLAIDTFLKIYFRVNRLSQNSRSWIAEHMYEVQRWKGLIAYVSRKPLTWTNMLNAYLVQNRWRNLTCNKSIAPHIRCSFPEQLFSLIEDEYGLDKALEMCNILNEEPITFVRVNTFRMSREKAYKFLIHKGLPVEKCIHSACGLIVSDRKRLLEAPEYRAGVVEIQDEGSQVVGNMVEVKPGDKVLDYCAGSGGKSLVFGVKMGNKGRILLHDTNANLLGQAKRRFKRAGIRNYLVLDPNLMDIERFYGKMDWVVADVPCTGSAAYRQSPDRKWNFRLEQLSELTYLQRSIIDSCIPFMKPKGKLVYITCSIFGAENRLQVDHLCKKHSLRLADECAKLPQSRGMNGYYLAVLERLP